METSINAKKAVLMNKAESQLVFQKCVCGSIETEIRITESKQLVVCSKCGRVLSKFQW
jgi:hypothetical protein